MNEAAQAISFFFTSQPKATPVLVKRGSGEARGTTAVSSSASQKSDMSASTAVQQAAVVHAEGPASGAGATTGTIAKTARSGRRYDEMRFRVKTASPEWDEVIHKLAQSCGLDAKSGVQCDPLPVPAYPEKGFRRPQGYSARKAVELHTRGSDAERD